MNFTSIFKVFATRAIWKTLKIQVKLILNCPRALSITYLSHKAKFFNMTRGEGGDIEGGLRKFLHTRRGGSEKIVGLRERL